MAIRSLERAQRQAYFERISRTIGAGRAEIEISGMDIGAQTQASDINLTGLSYDPRSDEIEIFTDEIEHHIPHPREVYVDAVGNKQILRLKHPLQLPDSGKA